MFISTPSGNHAIVGHLWQHFRQFPITLQSAMPIADIGLFGFSMGPLARSIIGCTIGGLIPLLCWGSMMNPMSEHPNLGMPVRGMSDMGRGGVPVWCTGLLMEARACEPSDSGVVAATEASAICCSVVASASLIKCMGITPGLAAVEMHQEGSLIESVELIS